MHTGVRERMLEAIPLSRTAAANEVSKPVLFLASVDATYFTGSQYVIDGVWKA